MSALDDGGLGGSGGSGGLYGSVEATSDEALGITLALVRDFFERFVLVTDDLDLDVLTLWAAHTHVVLETYSSPRLMIDSTMPGAGKTITLDILSRFCLAPVQAASISSGALLARLLVNGIRTILIDEVDRSLNPKKEGVEDLIAILNSGYRRGATRPVLMKVKGDWEPKEMPTYAPVAMAGNSPNLPDDTRSRSIRILLMPDLYQAVESTDWERDEPDVADLAIRLADDMDACREFILTNRPSLPAGCGGRMKEKWSPLKRVAVAAGGRWPGVTDQLIARDMEEAEMEREDGLTKLPPQMVMLTDLYKVWSAGEEFVASTELVSRLTATNPDYWGALSAYGRALTVQRLGKILSQVKVHSTRDSRGYQDVRGYRRGQFELVWRRSGLTPRYKPPEPPEAPRPAAEIPADPACPVCHLPSLPMYAQYGYVHPSCDTIPPTEGNAA